MIQDIFEGRGKVAVLFEIWPQNFGYFHSHLEANVGKATKCQ